MWVQVILFIVGLLILYLGAEWLVKGSAELAKGLGLSPFIIGLTVVAFGTSAPELFVSLTASFKQNNDIVMGNIIGSNIANIGLVLGLAALIYPLKVSAKTLRTEVPMMIGATILFCLLAYDLKMSLLDGCILVLGIVLFIIYTVRNATQKEPIPPPVGEAISAPGGRSTGGGAKHVGLLLIGLGGLMGGAHLMVNSGVYIAKQFGVRELVIGLTLIALGTSLPELAISIVAAYRRETALCIGNALGSNIFNILFVLGGCALVNPIQVDPLLWRFELPVMLVFSFILFVFMKGSLVINRIEGGVLLAGYGIFIAYLF